MKPSAISKSKHAPGLFAAVACLLGFVPSLHAQSWQSTRFQGSENSGQCFYEIEQLDPTTPMGGYCLSIDVHSESMDGRQNFQVPLGDIKGPLMREDDPSQPAVHTSLGGWKYLVCVQMKPDKEPPLLKGYGRKGPGGYFSIGFDNQEDTRRFLRAIGYSGAADIPEPEPGEGYGLMAEQNPAPTPTPKPTPRATPADSPRSTHPTSSSAL